MNTVLKFIVTVVVLTGLFIGVIMFVDKGKKNPGPKDVTSKQDNAAPSIKELSVIPNPEGVLVKIGEVSQDSYEIVSHEGDKELVIKFPKSKLTVENKHQNAPHALVQSIDATDNGAEGSQIQIKLADAASANTRMLGSFLFVDVAAKAQGSDEVATSEVPVEPMPTMKPAPAPTPKRMDKPKTPKRSVTAKAPKKNKAKNSDVAKVTPKAEKPVIEKPAKEENNLLNDLLGGDTAAAPDLPLTAPTDMGVTPDGGLPPLGEPDASNNVASVPRDFDNTPQNNLPSVNNLSVTNEGGATKILVSRETKSKFKVFKMVNPNRVVVEFLGLANKLQKEYGGFPGTKVQRVSTTQFSGPDGTITRLTFYVEGQGDYQRDNNGEAFMLLLP